jgi:type I restriction enzyme S subunit
MIDDLSPYAAMKDSGVPWLGEVPEHWEVQRLRNLADMRVSNVDKHTKDDEQPVRLCNYVDVYKNDYIRPSMSLMRATATKEEIERFRLAEGDVLITKDSEAWNDIGVPALVRESADDLVSGYHLALLRPFPQRIAGEFLFRSLQSVGVQYQFHVEANGVTRYGLSHAAIKSVWLPAAPLSEQAAIVRFLDHVDRRIRRYIRAKQKQIKLLEELKAAIIHRAVTRGLDPNVRLKPSGVEWLGDVPEHWELVALRYLATKFGSGVTPRGGAQVYQAEGVPFIRSQNVHFGGLRLDTVARLSRLLHEQMAATHVRPSDVLLNITGASLGRACAVPENFVEGSVNQHVCIIRPRRSRIDPQYLAAFLSTPEMQTRIYLSQNGSSREGLTLRDIRALPVLVPPLEEQRAIIHWAGGATAGIDQAITRAGHETDLLREYRTRLIADVVTGKLDVREAAARLPDAVPLESIEDDAGLSDETEASLEDADA